MVSSKSLVNAVSGVNLQCTVGFFTNMSADNESVWILDSTLDRIILEKSIIYHVIKRIAQEKT